jgi:hypothetical protein
MALIVLHPNNKNYIRYKLNRLEEEIEEMVEARRKAVKEGKGAVVSFSSEETLINAPHMTMLIED